MIKEMLLLTSTPFSYRDTIFLSVPAEMNRHQQRQLNTVVRVYEKHYYTLLYTPDDDCGGFETADDTRLGDSARKGLSQLIRSNNILFVGDWRDERDCLVHYVVAGAIKANIWELTKQTRIKSVNPATVSGVQFL